VAFRVSDGRVREVAVGVGRRIGELVAVSGLAAGDKVVLHPAEDLSDGMAVRLATK
jgi:hypothetical protein